MTRQTITAGTGLLGLACVIAVLVVAAYPSFTQCAYCTLIAPFASPRAGHARFLSCSNIEQYVTRMEGVVVTPLEISGWSVIQPEKPDQPGTVAVRLRKDRNDVIFYPRLGDTASAVEVWEKFPENRLVRLSGTPGKWTGISTQYHVNLFCLNQGYAEDFLIDVTIALKGGKAQLWVKDGVVFF